MSVLGSILASASDGETTSSGIFYAVGGVLAVWAVLVSLIGIAKPGFPGKAAARGVMLLTLVLVVGATGTAVITS